MQAIIAVLNAQGDTNAAPVSKAFSEGIYVDGERYVATRIEDRHIYARKVRSLIIP